MERGKPAASFLCSPIPRDPTQLLFVDDGSSNHQTPSRRTTSIFDSAVKDMTGRENTTPVRVHVPPTEIPTTSTGSLVSLDGANGRGAKRPRLEAESAAIVKSELLSTEVASLRVQLDRRTESHQIQLKERDQQLSQLRRQLQYALTEEEHTRAELKTLTNEYANEKLQLQKKVVELESKLQFVEDSFSEWREKSDDTISELRSAARKSKLTIQLLNDEIESLKQKAAPPPPSEYSALESKIKLLETRLRDKDLEVQAADERIQNASMTLESSKEVRSLNERINELESQERRLKQELVELISSSRNSAVQDEKLAQMRRKLQASDDRNSQAQQEIAKLNQQLEKSERECAALEKRLGRGEFNAETTKVVHLAINPTSELLGLTQQSKELEYLRSEVAHLRSQLSAQTPGVNAPTTPVAVTTPASELTTTTSYETVEGQKLLNQRLKEIFQNQIKQYREAIYQLTGFKVDLRKSNGVEILTLRSMYADHDDDQLIVRMEPDGSLELLPSDFSAHIDKRVFSYLTTCRSFPAFLSTLTLHLFEKQTFQGT